MKAIAFIAQFKIFSKEGRASAASNSEINRWIKQNSIVINGEFLNTLDEIDFPIISLVLFPKGKKITLL